MKFLLDANLPRSTAALLRRFGHDVEDVRDVLPAGSSDSDVAAYAKRDGRVLITRDFDFADIRNYPPEEYDGIAVIAAPDDAVAGEINGIVEAFVTNEGLMRHLRHQLAIVERWRVRFRGGSR